MTREVVPVDQARFDDYIALYNSGDYRRVAEEYWTDDIGIVQFGWTLARNAEELLDWCHRTREGISHTVIVEEAEFDEFGLRMWSRQLSIFVCHNDNDLVGLHPLTAGQVYVAPVTVQHLFRDNRIARILLEENHGQLRILRPDNRIAPTGYRRGQSVSLSRAEYLDLGRSLESDPVR